MQWLNTVYTAHVAGICGFPCIRYIRVLLSASGYSQSRNQDENRGQMDGQLQKILDAAKHGDLEQLQLILKRDVTTESGPPPGSLSDGEAARLDINSKNSDGETSLHLAVTGGDTKCARTLLTAGADPNIKTKEGHCLLHLASGVPDTAMAQLLLDHGAVVNCQSSAGGWLPLHEACRYGCVETVRLLVSRGSVLEVPVYLDGRFVQCDWQPIHFAVCNGHVACVDELINAGASVDVLGGPDQNSPLLEAIYYGQFACTRSLLQHGANVQQTNHIGVFPLLRAVGKPDRSLEFTSLLIEHGADVNQQLVGRFSYGKPCRCPLSEWATSGKSSDVLDKLLLYGADLPRLDSTNPNPALFDVIASVDESLLLAFINICHRHGCLDLMRRSNQWQRTVVGELVVNAGNWRRNESYLRNALKIVLAAGASATGPSGNSNIPPIKSVIKKRWRDAMCVMTEGNIWGEGELQLALEGSGLSLGQVLTSLQASCRFVIRHSLGRSRLHLVRQLPVSRSMKDYLFFGFPLFPCQ